MSMVHFIEIIDRFFSKPWKEAFRFMMRAILWGIVIFILIPFLGFGLVFYLHLHPYGHADFNQKEWLLDHKDELGVRCGMALTVVEDVLKPSMTRSEVEALLGIGYTRSHPTDKSQTVDYEYNLGWCSPMAWDPYLMIITYDENDLLIKAYNIQG